MVSDLVTEKLQLPNLQQERIRRVGQRQDDRHRPIMVRFTRFSDRVTKLKGTVGRWLALVGWTTAGVLQTMKMNNEDSYLLDSFQAQGKIRYTKEKAVMKAVKTNSIGNVYSYILKH